MILLVLVYLVLTLTSLTALPVFSDEAIYIRWSQVAMRVPEKYLFLPMLDGKPPLHAWLMMPFIKFFSDPLFAGRLFSVLTGLITMLILPRIVRLLGGGKREQQISAISAMILPYMYFHNRMALAESLMGCVFAVCLYAGLQIYREKSWKFAAMFALSFGTALWTKTTALFFIPVFALLPLLSLTLMKKPFNFKHIKMQYLSFETGKLVVAGIAGGLLFALLAFVPLFPSLFSRSADYTFSLGQLLGGEWRYVLGSSLPNALIWFVWYLSPFAILLAFFGGARNKVLGLMALGYFVPLIGLGRVLSARYFYPLTVIAVLMLTLGFGELLRRNAKAAWGLFAGVVLYSGVFILFSLFNPAYIPFTMPDRLQYLTTWSSGYGIPEIVEVLNKEASQHDHITVATEGFFGTLPDGLQIYFDNSSIADKLSISGIGEPIYEFPHELRDLAGTEPVYVVVNKDRFFVNDPDAYTTIGSYPRPFDASPLLLLQLKSRQGNAE